jgi:hypothetical protein
MDNTELTSCNQSQVNIARDLLLPSQGAFMGALGKKPVHKRQRYFEHAVNGEAAQLQLHCQVQPHHPKIYHPYRIHSRTYHIESGARFPSRCIKEISHAK